MQKKIGIVVLACIVVSSLSGMGFNAYMNSRHRAELISNNLPVIAQKTAVAADAMKLRAQNFVGRYDQRESLGQAAEYMAKAAQEASALTGKEVDFAQQLRQMDLDFDQAYGLSTRVDYDLSQSYQRSTEEGIALCKVLHADSAAGKARTGDADAVFAADALYADAVSDLATLQEYYDDAAQGSGKGCSIEVSAALAVRRSGRR